MQLTTRQRDVLQYLLNADEAVVVADIARQLDLTPRQVSYSLSGLKGWLQTYDVEVSLRPGVGVQLVSLVEGQSVDIDVLGDRLKYDVVLTPTQRQILLTFALLYATEPYILHQLQMQLDVSRNTIAKDLDEVDTWLQDFDLTLERRPNLGCWIEGPEWEKRIALNTLLWTAEELSEGQLVQLNHAYGLKLQLGTSKTQLPVINQADKFVKQLKVKKAIDQIAYAEAVLGGRYTDDAVLYLGMVLSIQTLRQRHGHILETPILPAGLDLEKFSAWGVASKVLSNHSGRRENSLPEAEITYLTMHLLSAMRNERWPSDSEADGKFSSLIADVIEDVAVAYEIEELRDDLSLRDGLYAYIYPVWMRHRFALQPVPARTESLLPAKYEFEHTIAKRIGKKIKKRLGVRLLSAEINNIALLLRAAYIRERPVAERHIVVVCPSGMATAQLLVARLKARFPRLGVYTILSVRDLTVENLAAASLVITTTTLSSALIKNNSNVIQVHPLLLPDDVETITNWMA